MHAADWLPQRARLSANQEALYELASDRRFTYRELNERANRAAHVLSGLGVRPGDRVALLAHNGVVYLDLLFASLKIGASFTPLNWRLTAAELVYILRDMEPAVLLVGRGFEPLLEQLRAQAELPSIVRVEGADLDAPDYETALQQASAVEPDRPRLAEDTAACLLYTSGTTGKPKGAVLPHRQILWNCINTVVSWGLTADDVTPVFTPMFHTGGLFAYLAPVLFAGGRVVLGRTFEADASLRVIEEERCTVILGVPTIYTMWVQSPEWATADFSSVRHFNTGGAPCPPALMERVRNEKNVIFRQGYGLTEVGPNCFSMSDAESRRLTGTVGRPILNSSVRLVDPETGLEAGVNEPGELLITGPHVCSGYWRNEAATRESIVDGWFRTGDTAVRAEDGCYRIVGRYKDMIKSGGENIYAAEVEAVVREHAAVADAALIGQPDAQWGEVGLLIVVRRPGFQATSDDLLQFCTGRLARYKVPKRVIFTDALPYSSYGKVQKNELRRRYLQQVTS